MSKERHARLSGFGPGRHYVERASAGEIVAIVDDEGRPVAYLTPATEEVTETFIAEYLRQRPGWDEEARQSFISTARRLAQEGYRYHRLTNRFLPPAGLHL
jgi:antitoxin (DNA-binding transcriptional repressor) of toxin-antitoxin stability system